jgi:predicted RNase H-like nuclease
MVPIWPFRKKIVESAKASKIIEKKVVEYEREIRDDSVNKNDRSHLTNKNFIDAMALLSEDINE